MLHPAAIMYDPTTRDHRSRLEGHCLQVMLYTPAPLHGLKGLLHQPSFSGDCPA